MFGGGLRCRLIALAVMSATCLIVAIICTGLYFSFNIIKRHLVMQNIVIKPGSLSTNFLMKPTNTCLLEFWFFNVTNADQIGPLVKPKLQTIGPYVYRKHSEALNFEWSPDGQYTSLTIFMNTTYEFQGRLSVGDPENDVLFSTKIPDITVSTLFEKYLRHPKIRKIIHHFLQPILKTTPHKLLWGYEDKLLKIGRRLAPEISITSTVGLLHDTGVRDQRKLGFLLTVENKSELDVWSHPEANQFLGPMYAFTPPDVTVGSYRDMFAEIVCRALKFKVTDTVPHPNFEQLKVYRMSLLPETFHSALDYPPNRKYVLNSTLGPKVLPSGVLDLSKCLAVGGLQIPIYGSLPFFRDAATEVSTKVEFMSMPPSGPDIDLKIEPQTGVILEGTTRFQFSMYSKGTQNHGFFRQFPDDIFLPFAYVLNYDVSSPEELENLHYILNFLPTVAVTLMLSLICLFLLAIIVAMVIFYRLNYQLHFSFTYLFSTLRAKN
uniref:Scavenger receptor class B member 1 n=1 Tax=Schistocephalus solidus TaxID=70667 RepID=A0A0X3Q495_SCHSO